MKLWQIILLIAAVVAMAMTTISYARRFTKLGALIVKGKNGIRYTNKGQLIMLALMFTLLAISYFTSEDLSKEKMYFIFYGGVILTFTIMQLVFAVYPKGVYENGISTDSAVLLYPDVFACHFTINEKKSLAKFVFNDTGKFLSSSVCIYIPQGKENEAKVFLKKKGCFKKHNGR